MNETNEVVDEEEAQHCKRCGKLMDEPFYHIDPIGIDEFVCMSCHEETITKEDIINEDGMQIFGYRPISKEEKDGFERIHDWDHYTREVLNNILVAIEEKQRLGYFDSLIDVETNCNLINMARAIYIDLFNENKNGERFRNPHTKITKEMIDKQCRGGYSTKFKERLYKLLVNA